MQDMKEKEPLYIVICNKKNRKIKVIKEMVKDPWSENIRIKLNKKYIGLCPDGDFQFQLDRESVKVTIVSLRQKYKRRKCEGCRKRNYLVNMKAYTDRNRKKHYFCTSCYEKKYCICSYCSNIVLKKSSKKSHDDRLICKICQDDFIPCSKCKKLYKEYDGMQVRDGYVVCNTCFNKSYIVCPECGKVTKKERAILHILGRYYCKKCLPPQIYTYHMKDEDDNVLGRKMKARGSRYKVGIEIEKEDKTVIQSINAETILKKTGWIVEKDNSLNRKIGFEAVSPILPLDAKLFDKTRRSIKSIQKIIDAKQTYKCGGHLHISDTLRGPEGIMIDIKGYTPLLYAMYPKRVGRLYSVAKLHSDYIKGHREGSRESHEQAFNITPKTLEIRIFPSPRSIPILEYRLNLVRFMLDNISYSLDQALNKIAERGELYEILSKVYTDRQILKKMEGAIWYAIEYREISSIFKTDALDKFSRQLAKRQPKKEHEEAEAKTVAPTRKHKTTKGLEVYICNLVRDQRAEVERARDSIF